MSSISNKITAFYYGYNLKPMEIKKDCKIKYTINKKKGKRFDIGAFGSISEACLNSNCDYIVKLIPLSNPRIEQTFKRETLLGPFMNKKGIGPKIYDIYQCLDAGFIIMDKWEGSIRKLVETQEFKKKHLKVICEIIKKMNDLGVIHNDLHTANILYRKKKNAKEKDDYEFCITDYGLSLYFEDKDKTIPKIFLPNLRSPNIYYPAFDFYKFSNALESRSAETFIEYFYLNDYITPLQYLIINKYTTRSYYDDELFNEFYNNLKFPKKENAEIKNVKNTLDNNI